MEWFKVMCNLLDHRKIKMIRKGPEGNTLVLLWLLLLAEAGKSSRGGYLMISDSMPYTAETIGMVTDISLPTVQLGLKTFSVLDMVDQEDGAIFIKNWGKYQSEEKLEARRENDRKRQQRHRESERQKLLVSHVTPLSRDHNVTLSRDVTPENKGDDKQEETTLEQLRVLFSGTPLSKVTDPELLSFSECYGMSQLLLASDIAAETWRRSKDKVSNPAGYLRSFCASLIVPGWYVPFEARNAAAQANECKKASVEAEKEDLHRRERAEAAARNALWESLSDEDRDRHHSAALAEIPASLAPSMSIALVETAKFRAWDEALRSQRDSVGDVDVS